MSLQEFHDSGLVWLANRALHPFGYALMVSIEVAEGETPDLDGDVKVVESAGLRVVRTTDPLGLLFDEKQEDRSRRRFFRWLTNRTKGAET